MRLATLAILASAALIASIVTKSARAQGPCGATTSDGTLDGRAVDDQARPIASALVSVSWKPGVDSAPASAGEGRFTMTDDSGRWSMCSLPFGTLVVRAAKAGLADATLAVLDSAHPHDWVSLELAHRINGNATSSAAVAIMLVNDHGVPIDATIEMTTSAGVKQLKTTNGTAFATLPGPERISIAARAIGYKPGSVIAAVDRGTNTIPLIMNPSSVPMLAPLRVIGDREVLARHNAFEERRRLGLATVSITAEEIEKRNPASTWQMLTGVSSVRILPFGNGTYARSNRGDRMINLQLRPCWMRLMIDGVVLPDTMPDLSNLPAPSEIHGIEVFAGPASIPPQYNSTIGGNGNSICGLIALWTK